MKKNFWLSLIIILFSFISFLLFTLEAYLLQDKLDAFYFLLIAFTYIFIFSVIINIVIYKLFNNNGFYKQISISFLIIMISLLIINLLELVILKSNISIDENSFLFFISSILSTLRLTSLFSIPIYFISNILEFIKNRMFKEKINCENI